MIKVKSQPVNLALDPSLPVSLFDPKWNEPEVAARVARRFIDAMPFTSGTALLDEGKLPEQKKSMSEVRTFTLGPPVAHEGAQVRAGSYGELHRRYAYGGGRPTANFHAQAVAFGVLDDGRFYLRGRVGCYDGAFGNACALTVKLMAGDACLGGIVWTGALDPKKDVDVAVAGTSDVVKARFHEIDRAVLAFSATPPQGR